MSKFVAFCLLSIVCLVFITVGCGFVQSAQSGQDGKHTGYVTVRKTDKGGGDSTTCSIQGGCVVFSSLGSSDARHYEFIRPNGEIFEMNFAGRNDAPDLNVGDTLKDIIYIDLKDHKQFFVKAILDHESPNGTGNTTSAGLFDAPVTEASTLWVTKGEPDSCLHGDGTVGLCRAQR